MLKKLTLLLTLPLLFCALNTTAQKKNPPKATVKKDSYLEYQKQFSFKDDPAPVKFVKAYLDTIKYVPKHFYIAAINDSTGNNDSIGFTLQPKSGKSQRLSFEGGTKAAFTNYFDKKLAADSSLYPLTFNITRFSITEVREKPYDNASISYRVEYLFPYKNKLEKITSYSGKGYLMTPIGMKKKYDSLISGSFEKQFAAVDDLLEDAIDKSPMFCKGVKMVVKVRSDDMAPDSDTVFYDKDRELTWADFKGGSNGAENTFASYIGLTCDPDMDYSGGYYHGTVRIGADFIKSSSWVGKEMKEQEILYHMRYRLKLAGVYSLKFKKRLEETSFTCDNFNAELRKLYTDTYKELNVLMDQYSKETKYGQSKKEEMRWERKIEAMLDEIEK